MVNDPTSETQPVAAPQRRAFMLWPPLRRTFASILAPVMVPRCRLHDRPDVFRLRAPDAEHLSHFLARQRTAPLTYPEDGATLGGVLPDGYHHDHSSIVVGHGDAAWAKAQAGIDGWQAATAARITIEPSDAPIAVGTTVGVLTRVGPVQVLAACRIVAVVDEPDRYGFAYGTLPAHPEEGEELFLVTRADDGTISFEITVFSRPHDLLTKLGGPVARHVQQRATRRYLEGMRTFVASP